MIFNDQETSQALLEWINGQRKILGYQNYVIEPQSIMQDDSINSIMKSANINHFAHIDPNKDDFIGTIEIYMEIEHGKKLKKNAEVIKTRKISAEEAISFCYYCCTQSQHKQKFIDRILSQSMQTQQILMKQFKNIQDQFENIMEIKEIIQQIEELEQVNWTLLNKLNQMLNDNKLLANTNKQIQDQNAELKLQLIEQKKQKQVAFKSMKIGSLSEYMEVYAKLYQQNLQLEQIIEQLSIKYKQSCEQSNNLSDRVKSDCQQIHYLSEQLNKYKQLLKEAKQHILEPNNNSVFTGVDRSLQVNNNKINTPEVKTQKNKLSLEITKPDNKENAEYAEDYDYQICLPEQLNDIQCTFDSCTDVASDYEGSYQDIVKVNKDLMEKLESMYTIFNQMNKESIMLDKEEEQLLRKASENKKILKKFKKQQNMCIQGYFKIQGNDRIEPESIMNKSARQYFTDTSHYLLK